MTYPKHIFDKVYNFIRSWKCHRANRIHILKDIVLWYMGRIHFYVWKWMINKANITCDPTCWNGFANFHSVLVILYFPNFGWKFYKLIKEKGTKMFPWLLFLLLKTFISPGISSCNYFERFTFWFILFCKEELLWLLD